MKNLLEQVGLTVVVVSVFRLLGPSGATESTHDVQNMGLIIEEIAYVGVVSLIIALLGHHIWFMAYGRNVNWIAPLATFLVITILFTMRSLLSPNLGGGSNDADASEPLSIWLGVTGAVYVTVIITAARLVLELSKRAVRNVREAAGGPD
ncbi:MAG: hypothetical protein Q4G34_09265 [Micrococcus sp.]|nr:hypothetical protein [Micrococcus sp.]